MANVRAVDRGGVKDMCALAKGHPIGKSRAGHSVWQCLRLVQHLVLISPSLEFRFGKREGSMPWVKRAANGACSPSFSLAIHIWRALFSAPEVHRPCG
jgi:hypothetical protein